MGDGHKDVHISAGDLPELLHKQEIYIQEDKGKVVIMRLYGNVYRNFIEKHGHNYFQTFDSWSIIEWLNMYKA